MKEIKKIVNSKMSVEKRIDLTVDKSGVNKGTMNENIHKAVIKMSFMG